MHMIHEENCSVMIVQKKTVELIYDIILFFYLDSLFGSSLIIFLSAAVIIIKNYLRFE